MKHYLIPAIIMALSFVPITSHAYDFSAVNDDGVTIYYNILSEEEKTCEVTYGISEDTYEMIGYTGDFVIPPTANGYTVTQFQNGIWSWEISSVTLPNTITSIADNAFSWCSLLSFIVIPNSVSSIGKKSFYECMSLETVIIGDGVETIGESAFENCKNLKTVSIGKSVKDIGNNAFKNCSSISSLELNMSNIGYYWFRDWTIETLIIGNNVKTIGNRAFEGCSSLTTVSLPNSLTTIGNNAFGACTSLTAIILPNSLTTIGNLAFYACELLTSIEIPNSVKSIGYSAFDNCKGLKSVKIGDSNSISNSSMDLGANAFSDCTCIESLSLGNAVSSIGAYAFNDCKLLTSVSIPKSVTSIGDNPFAGCSNMESIIVENGNINYNSDDNCNAIIETNSGKLVTGCKNTIIPNSIKAIGPSAFSDCVELNSATIPSTVNLIGSNAFNNCKSLQSITIPSSVTSIGYSAFSNCTNLSTIYSEITDFFDIDRTVFQGSENTTLYVPKGMATTYRSSTGWSVIKYIEEMPDDTPDASFLISCSNRGSVSINGSPSITNKIAAADINEGTDNTFTFTTHSGCRLDQVILNGLDITANVQNNTLTCTIPANSQMIVTFTTEQGDLNNDGRIDISDVVSIVNKILSIQ